MFVDSFVDYVKKSDENKSNSNPSIYWYSSPYLFGTAHAGTEFITQVRAENFANITKFVLLFFF